MRVKPDSLRRLANKLQSSPVTGALYESATYIEQLEQQLSELCPIADLPVIESLKAEKRFMQEHMKKIKVAAEHVILEYENLYGCENPISKHLSDLIKDI
jgi:hypothetical protein